MSPPRGEEVRAAIPFCSSWDEWSLMGPIEIYWWFILQTHNLVLIVSYYVKRKGSGNSAEQLRMPRIRCLFSSWISSRSGHAELFCTITRAVNTPYRNMFSLMCTSSFVLELTQEITKPMSKFECKQNWRTLATKIVPGLAAATVGWSLQTQAACNNGVPRRDWVSNQHIESSNCF